MKKIFALAVAAACFVPGAASATTITFAGQPDGTSATTEYLADGVTLSNFSYYTDSHDTFDGAGIAADTPRASVFFSTAEGDLSLDYISLPRTSVTISTFNNGNLLETRSISGGGSYTNGTITFALSGITSLVVTPPASGVFGISTLRFGASAVPEPASWAMMISGFGIIGATMRRKKAVITFA